MKQVLLSLALILGAQNALAGSTISGTIGVRLEVLPVSGCIDNRCALDPRQTDEDLRQGKTAHDFKASRKGHVLTIEF